MLLQPLHLHTFIGLSSMLPQHVKLPSRVQRYLLRPIILQHQIRDLLYHWRAVVGPARTVGPVDAAHLQYSSPALQVGSRTARPVPQVVFLHNHKLLIDLAANHRRLHRQTSCTAQGIGHVSASGTAAVCKIPVQFAC
jgi:hypothetical protein